MLPRVVPPRLPLLLIPLRPLLDVEIVAGRRASAADVTEAVVKAVGGGGVAIRVSAKTPFGTAVGAAVGTAVGAAFGAELTGVAR